VDRSSSLGVVHFAQDVEFSDPTAFIDACKYIDVAAVSTCGFICGIDIRC
jgi:hypothetical protein